MENKLDDIMDIETYSRNKTMYRRHDLIMKLHGPGGMEEEDPIILGTSQCTKCKKIYEPNFFTEEF
jgi:hypothetical protein